MKEKILSAENISFCFGVQKSLNLINKLLEEKKYKHIYMLGEIIHNEQVISDLKQKGLKIIKDINKIPKIPKNSIVIIQSHGVGPHVYENLKKKNVPYIDSTCPLVKKIHRSVKELENQGYSPLILGSPSHTEVIGISGYADTKPIIINGKKDIKKDLFKNTKKIGIVMQSTFFYDKVPDIVKSVKKYVPDVKIIDTICEPTKSRQKEAAEKAGRYKSVVVIGSHNSSNTNKLYKIAKQKNKNTFFIASEKDIQKYEFANLLPVFLISGASAPLSLIEKVKQEILINSNLFLKFSNTYKSSIEKEITDILQSRKKIFKDKNISLIFDALTEFCLRPGKRIRPLLVLWSYLAFGGTKKNFSQILKAAALIEIMHAFLLIHDDIIDDSDVRRGKKSFHLIMEDLFSEQTLNPHIGRDLAIVAGDLLFTLSIETIAGLKISDKIKTRFSDYFGQCYKFTCIGQTYDILASQMKRSSDKTYYDKINLLKTSYYTIYYPMLMGYSLTGKPQANREFIEKTAVPLGTAFQMRDDIISLFGIKEETGKPNDSDILEGKMTILIDETIKLSDRNTKKQFEKLFFKTNKNKKDIKEIKQIIQQSGAVEKVQSRIDALFSKSLSALKKLPVQEKYKNIISDLILILKQF